MKSQSALRRLAIALAGLALLALPAIAATVSTASAHDYTAGDLKIDHPWSRPTFGELKITAGYMSIENKGSEPDTLMSASADIAGKVEIHESLVEDGKAIMRALPDGISIPAGGVAELKPQGMHIMFMGLKQPLKEGESFPMTLNFKRAGAVTVDVKVETGGDGKETTSGNHSGHDHSSHDHSGHDHSGHHKH